MINYRVVYFSSLKICRYRSEITVTFLARFVTAPYAGHDVTLLQSATSMVVIV